MTYLDHPDFTIGFESVVKTMEDIAADDKISHRDALAGALTACLSAMFYLAPNEEAATAMLQFATMAALAENNKMEGLDDDADVIDCQECAAIRRGEMAPPHKASASCESGGRNHCSCDMCF